ncbi:MAG: hypothetical protein H6679_02030 [Epsilonproteobacteria bacterium]|nr:hypothetical protein [Campylobacterota bacterium]
MTDYVGKILERMQALTSKQAQQIFFVWLAIIISCCATIVYTVHKKSNAYVEQIKQSQLLTKKVAQILAQNERMSKEEERLRRLLDQNQGFTIKSFFEQFVQQQGIAPDPGWDARAQNVNDQFDEVLLRATFRNMTMEKLVTVLDTIDKNPIVYVHEVSMRRAENKTMVVDLTLATKRYKTTLE